jgi:hypothetical protein
MAFEHELGRLIDLQKREALEKFQAYLTAVNEHFGIEPQARTHRSHYPEHFMTILGIMSGLREGELNPESEAQYDSMIAAAADASGEFDPVKLFKLLTPKTGEGKG